MHGGMKIYAGPPPAARQYLEADRGRADDYYLAEGAGIARRYTATAGQVQEQPPLTGEGYEAWVAGGGTRRPVGRAGDCAPTSGRCGSSRSWSTARSPGRWPRRCTPTSPPP